MKHITDSVQIPAIAYSYVDGKDSANNASITYGLKDAEHPASESNNVDDATRFPAASLSKVVFSYLVLRLVKDKRLSLDEKLFNDEFPLERVMVEGAYPNETTKSYAESMTVEHVLSHTSGLPNVGAGANESVTFNSKPGEKYGYSGEAILCLQNCIERKLDTDLQSLAQEYLFAPQSDSPKSLGMTRSTFLPPSTLDANIVQVHTELGKSMSIEESLAPFKEDSSPPAASAVGTLLTTAEDFSKFLNANVKLIGDKLFNKAFEPYKGQKIPTFDNIDESRVCGLGWHLYKDEKGRLIAYQFGENINMRAFAAINVNDKKAAAYFTNCNHGMSIANQIFSSPDLAPIGDTQKLFKSMPHHTQSDEPGWQETLNGKIAESKAINLTRPGNYLSMRPSTHLMMSQFKHA